VAGGGPAEAQGGARQQPHGGHGGGAGQGAHVLLRGAPPALRHSGDMKTAMPSHNCADRPCTSVWYSDPCSRLCNHLSHP